MLSSLVAMAVMQAGGVDIPFRIQDTAIIADAKVNGVDVSCMFDTGFSGSFVLNDTVNVGKASGVINLQDFVGVFQARTVDITSLQMGAKKVDSKGMTIVQQPTRDWSSSYGTHVDGIMGLEVFRDRVFQINFEKSKFVIYPDEHDFSGLEADGKKRIIKRMLPKGMNSIELTVKAPNGEKMYLALDTGNGFYATTHKDVLQRMKMWDDSEAQYETVAWVASGPVKSWYMQFPELEIYGVPVKDSIWSIIDLPASAADHDGTVGFGFLKNFNITIDMRRRMVMLEHFSGKTVDQPKGNPGIVGFYNERAERMLIYRVTPGSPAEKAGVKLGDAIIDVDGEFIGHLSPQQLEERLDGEPGTQVKLALSRGGQLLRFEVERAVLVNKPKTVN